MDLSNPLVNDLRERMFSLADAMAVTIAYDLPVEFVKNEASLIWSGQCGDDPSPTYTIEDFTKLDFETLKFFGFQEYLPCTSRGETVPVFDKDAQRSATHVLLTFPMYAYYLLSFGEILISTSGRKVIKSYNTNGEEHFNCGVYKATLAFGFPYPRNKIKKAENHEEHDYEA